MVCVQGCFTSLPWLKAGMEYVPQINIWYLLEAPIKIVLLSFNTGRTREFPTFFNWGYLVSNLGLLWI